MDKVTAFRDSDRSVSCLRVRWEYERCQERFDADESDNERALWVRFNKKCPSYAEILHIEYPVLNAILVK